MSDVGVENLGQEIPLGWNCREVFPKDETHSENATSKWSSLCQGIKNLTREQQVVTEPNRYIKWVIRDDNESTQSQSSLKFKLKFCFLHQHRKYIHKKRVTCAYYSVVHEKLQSHALFFANK